MPEVREWPSGRECDEDPCITPTFRPAPYLDSKVNSICFPAESDWLSMDESDNIPGFCKIRDLNYEIRMQERNLFIDSKGRGWKDQHLDNGLDPKYCRICSQFEGEDGQMRLYHHFHYSSRRNRVLQA